jgi:hypothetical protein
LVSCAIVPNSPAPLKDSLGDDDGTKPAAAVVSPGGENFVSGEPARNKAASAGNSKQSSSGEFMSYFRKAAAERQASKSGAEFCVKVSSIYRENSQAKAVVMVLMVDDSSQGYWCFKAEVVGLLYQSVSLMLDLECKNIMSSFMVLYKRSVDDPSTIELICNDKVKLKSLKPSTHGNRVIVYCVSGGTDEDVLSQIDSIVTAVNRINSDDQCKTNWFPAAMEFDDFKFTSNFKSATLSDATFWRLFKSMVVPEHNVPLDSVLASISVTQVVTEFLLNGPKVHPDSWSDSIKSIAYSSTSTSNTA